MSFGIYLLGHAILIGGLTWGASILQVPDLWIGAIVLVGIGILPGVKARRQKDSGS